MRTAKVFSCAALALLLAAAVPAEGNAQIGKLIKKAVKEKVTEAVLDRAASAAGVQADSQSTSPAAQAPTAGPKFTEHMLEMTPEVLDRVQLGLTAEMAVRQEMQRLIGKTLGGEEYDACRSAVIAGPEGQRVYMQAGDLVTGNSSQEAVMKASQELARRLDAIVVPKCGLSLQAAQEIRDRYAERLSAAAPQASGLATHQLYTLVERLVPLCKVIGTIAIVGEQARVPTELSSVFWVYSQREVQAAQPRCETLMVALNARHEFALARK